MHNVSCNALPCSVAIHDILISDYMRIWRTILVARILMRILIPGVSLLNKIVSPMGS